MSASRKFQQHCSRSHSSWSNVQARRTVWLGINDGSAQAHSICPLHHRHKLSCFVHSSKSSIFCVCWSPTLSGHVSVLAGLWSVGIRAVLVCVQGSDDACLCVGLGSCVVQLAMASTDDWGSSPQHVSVFAFTFGLNSVCVWLCCCTRCTMDLVVNSFAHQFSTVHFSFSWNLTL